MFFLTPENQLSLELAVTRGAEIHEQTSRVKLHYNRFFHVGEFDTSYPDLCVKYDNLPMIQCENSMLKHLYTLACEDGGSSPHVPRPVHYFDKGGKWGYIIMDCVEKAGVSEEELQIKTAEAVRWLHSKHPPPGTNFGTIGRSNATHTIFKYGMAPRMYNTVSTVEKYLNKGVEAAARLYRQPLSNLSLVNDEVILSQSDMEASNFGVAKDGRPIIFDAATIQAMPAILAHFTVLEFMTRFCDAVSMHVYSPSEREALKKLPSFVSLGRVRSFFIKCRHTTFDIDDDGNKELPSVVTWEG